VAVTLSKLSTGRRKESIARVRITPGEGSFTINGRTIDDYFPTRVHRMVALAPLRLVGRERDYDVIATIRGGGVAGQAGAVKLGVARALVAADPELRAQLKAEGYLRRDAREKERRKYGLKKARKAPQYSKC
jgi:small subunit ribosomal protein S9